MARASLLGTVGMIVSFSCLVVHLVFRLMIQGFGSPSTSHIDIDIFGTTLAVTFIYALATIIALFHHVGGILQIPPVGALSLLAWYEGSWFMGIFGMALPVFGSTLIILSWPMGGSMPGSRILASMAEEIRGWRPATTARNVWVVAYLVIVTLSLLGIFFGAVFTQEVAILKISVVVEGQTYGAVDLSIMVDGDILVSEHIEPGPAPEQTHMWYSLSLHVPSGTHRVLVDITSETYEATNGVIDARRDVRVLPFTEQTELFPIGVGLI